MDKCTIDYENRGCEFHLPTYDFTYEEYLDILRNVGDICDDVQEYLRFPSSYSCRHSVDDDWLQLMELLALAGDEYDERLGNEQEEVLAFIPDDSSDDSDSSDLSDSSDSSDSWHNTEDEDDYYAYPEWVRKGYGDPEDEAEPTRYINISWTSPSYQEVRDREVAQEREEEGLPPMYMYDPVPAYEYPPTYIEALGPVPEYSQIDWINMIKVM